MNHQRHQPHHQGGASQPVAYDRDGNPLYSQPQPVHLSRAMEPIEQKLSPEVIQLHNESQKKYPHLNLSRGEYVLVAVRRHPIGMLKIWAIGLGLVVAFFVIYYLSFLSPNASSELADLSGVAAIVLGFMLLLTVAGTLAASYVYASNRFYLTNESVIQEIQDSLFAHHEQTVSLSNIEDASYKQGGIIPVMLNYGMIRLSTEGDETTYRFSYVANPKRHIAVLNNAVEAFKNGRPVG